MANEPVHHLMSGRESDQAIDPPAPPRVTPEPAPSDTVLIAMSAAAGAFGTLIALGAWRFWRRRKY